MSIKTFVLSPFQKIAAVKNIFLSEQTIETPNSVINNSVLNENMASLPQVNFNKLPQAQVQINTSVDTSFDTVTGRGPINIPVYQDYYMGEIV